MVAEHDWKPRHALSTDQANLDLLLELDGYDRRESALQEIDNINSLMGVFQMLPDREIYTCQVRLNEAVVGCRQQGEQLVAAAWHGALLPNRRERGRVSQPPTPEA
jgi:hypothetical protein